MMIKLCVFFFFLILYLWPNRAEISCRFVQSGFLREPHSLRQIKQNELKLTKLSWMLYREAISLLLQKTLEIKLKGNFFFFFFCTLGYFPISLFSERWCPNYFLSVYMLCIGQDAKPWNDNMHLIYVLISLFIYFHKLIAFV